MAKTEEVRRLMTVFTCNDDMSKTLATISNSVASLSKKFDKLGGKMQETSQIDALENAPKSAKILSAIQDRLISSSSDLANKIGVSRTAQELFTRAILGSNTAMKSLMLTIAPFGVIAGALYATLGSMDKVDYYSGLQARLKLITGDINKVVELNGQLYSSAQRARGRYTEMADNVSRLGLLAGHAFNNTSEIVVFVEQLNKQFKIAGTGAQEASSAMYQLSQAMASGRLQGDEFQSIMENAPMLAQAIAKEMDVPIGKMKELSSAGLITSDVIKRALTSKEAIESVNEQFANIPVKFSELIQQLGNVAETSFSDVFEKIGGALNSDAMANIISGLSVGIAVIGAVASGVVDIFGGIGEAVGWVAGVFKALLGVAVELFPLIVAGASAWATNLAIANMELIGNTLAIGANATWQVVRQGLLIAENLLLKTLSFNTKAFTKDAIAARLTVAKWDATTRLSMITTKLATGAQWLFNTAIAFLPALIVGVIAGFVALTIKTKGLRNVMVEAWQAIATVGGNAINYLIDKLNSLIKVINAGGDMFGKLFGFEFKEIKLLNEIDVKGGVAKGTDFIQNFSMDSIKSMLGLDIEGIGGLGGAGIPNIEKSAEKIAENTGGIRDAIEDNFATVEELRDLALGDGVSNITKQDIKIEVVNHNSVNSEIDIDGIGDNIAQSLFRAVQINRAGV